MIEDATNIVAFDAPGKVAASARFNGSSTTMRSDLVEEAAKVIPSPPVLINLVSARVKQLNQGRSPLIRPEGRMGAADIALMEIIQGKISVDEDSRK
jgi:DNA-directed RNA polymerase subunit omega